MRLEIIVYNALALYNIREKLQDHHGQHREGKKVKITIHGTKTLHTIVSTTTSQYNPHHLLLAEPSPEIANPQPLAT